VLAKAIAGEAGVPFFYANGWAVQVDSLKTRVESAYGCSA
jgi:hypothetical protein